MRTTCVGHARRAGLGAADRRPAPLAVQARDATAFADLTSVAVTRATAVMPAAPRPDGVVDGQRDGRRDQGRHAAADRRRQRSSALGGSDDVVVSADHDTRPAEQQQRGSNDDDPEVDDAGLLEPVAANAAPRNSAAATPTLPTRRRRRRPSARRRRGTSRRRGRRSGRRSSARRIASATLSATAPMPAPTRAAAAPDVGMRSPPRRPGPARPRCRRRRRRGARVASDACREERVDAVDPTIVRRWRRDGEHRDVEAACTEVDERVHPGLVDRARSRRAAAPSAAAHRRARVARRTTPR